MKNSMFLLFIMFAGFLLSSCKPKCCSEPKVFFLRIEYKTKNQKSLLYTSENKDYRFNTRKIEVYKVLPDVPGSTELLKSRQRELGSQGDAGESSLYFNFPTEDKRTSQLLIYLYPSTDIDTIMYQGEGEYNIPDPKNVFYNGICSKELKLDGNSSSETAQLSIIVTKPD